MLWIKTALLFLFYSQVVISVLILSSVEYTKIKSLLSYPIFDWRLQRWVFLTATCKSEACILNEQTQNLQIADKCQPHDTISESPRPSSYIPYMRACVLKMH